MLIQYMAEKREGGLNAATDEDVADLQVGAGLVGAGGCWVGAGGWLLDGRWCVLGRLLSRAKAVGRRPWPRSQVLNVADQCSCNSPPVLP